MADLVLRLQKGIPLTNAEVDGNFSNLNEGQTIAGEPMGHEDRAQSVLSFNAATRTVTVAPTGSEFVVWCKGEKYVFTTAQTVVIPNTTGIHYIYFSSTGVLSAKLGYFDWHEDAPTAYVYWNATTQLAPFFADERHGITLDWQTHEYLHRTRGAALANGFSAGNYTLTGTGSADADAQFDLSGGTFFDEDLKVTIVATNTPTANTWEQDLTGPARIPVMYRSGNAWVLDSPTNFVLKAGTATPRYNTESGGVWGLTDVPNNSYSVSWVVATNNLNYPVVAIMGQAADSNSGDIEVLEWGDLNLDGFPAVEFRPLYKIVWQAGTGYANTIKARFTKFFDIRSLVSAGGAATIGSSHGALSGLGNDDHVQYLHVSEVRSPSQDVKNSFLPAQAGNNGKVLGTNGTAPAWVSLPTVNDGALTLGVSGTGLSGSATFSANQSGATTFTVTSNATSANTASAIVARDASGNFSANTITAALSGNASTATKLQTGRTIGMTGDVSWTSASFDGSGNVTGTATLADSGVTAGTYNNSATAVTPITFDAKGRATGTGAAVTITPAWDSITSKPTTLAGYGITDAQALDADLTAIAALSGTTGLLRKTAANTWELDTTAYTTNTGTVTSVGGTGGYGGLTLSGTVTSSGNLTLGGTPTGTWPISISGSAATATDATKLPLTGGTMQGNVNFNNFNITGLNNLSIGDPGPGEGIDWVGGNLWKIYESPNDLTTNGGGNLQIVQNTTRRATFNTSGQIEIPVANGTAPFLVSSATRVANLNVATAGTADTLTTARTINAVSFNGSANITIPRVRAIDDRTTAPADGTAAYATFGFGSWANNSSAPYADYWIMRSYTDSSGGADNMVSFRKDALGMRVWQQAYGSTSAFATYKDVAWTDGTNASGTWPISVTGNAATATNANNSNLLDNIDSTGFTQSGDGFSGDFNATFWTTASRLTSISSTANSPFGNTWYTVYNSRHRGGTGDGTSYGSQIAIGMTNYTNRIAFRNQNNTWSAWTELLSTANYSGYALPLTGGTVTGRILLSGNGNIAYSDSGGTYIPRPLGGTYKTTTATLTGALAIQLPTALYNQSDMLSFWVDIYDYSGNETVSIFVYGYAYGSNTGEWTNCGATILTPRTDRDYNVRFCHDGTRHVVCIGETGSTWSYPQVVVRDFQGGYSASPDTLDDGWGITFLTTLPTVRVTSSNNTVVAKQLRTARTIGGVSFDGSANINLPGVNIAGNQNTSGNAATATTLQTARTINGTSFNGSANITTANWGTARTVTIGSTGKSVNGSANVSWSRLEIGVPQTTTTTNVNIENAESCVAYVTNSLFGQADGALYSHVYSSSWKHQIQGDYRTGQIAIRGKNNGTWQAWRTVLDSGNYTSYAQATLVSGTNIKTINGSSVLGSGDLVVESGGGYATQLMFS